ncbi:MAG: VanW family protein [Lachnospirales bacterium]
MKNKVIFFVLIILTISLSVTVFGINTNAKESENVVLSRYTTYFGGSSIERVHNITRASNSINNITIMPKETFSFNNTVGEASVENGYKMAKVVVFNELVDGEGGGICQVSSTLYNAIDDAKLSVLERHSHTRDIGYVPLGEDATIVYGAKDFRFTNTLNVPVKIVSKIVEHSLVVEIQKVI